MDLKIGPDEATDVERQAVADLIGAQGGATIADGERLVLGGLRRAAERRHLLLPGLHALQRSRGFISAGGLNHLCESLGVPPADAYGVASFYDLFSMEEAPDTVVRICDDIGCRINGHDAIEAALDAAGLAATSRLNSPCLGLCDFGGAAVVQQVGADLRGVRVVAGPAEPVIESHLPTGPRLLRRIVGGDVGSLGAYLDAGGYRALRSAVELGAAAVIDAVSAAGLRGRGGAAFPTGVKWRAVADQPGPTKHVIANADESEPGTFKDRVLMEHDPFALVEALTLAGLATGASNGWIYVRGEYPVAVDRLRAAIAEARAADLLGTDVLGSGIVFDIDLRVGAGAYICGEETALFNSIEGFRGEPRQKPPFPTTNGLFDQPTAINNVETLVNVLDIVTDGVDAYRELGTPDSPGTRLFCLSGAVARPGLYEHPMGVTLRQVLAAAGGLADGREMRATLLGGAAGVFVDATSLDVPLTFEDTRAAGITLGSGVVMAFDETHDLRDTVARIAEFFRHESCGQCVPCRVGTQRQHELLVRTNGSGAFDAELFDDLAAVMKDASICGLGHTAASAIGSAARLGLLT
jgi:NADH-quinone oxidoreductase subunit F